MVDSIERIVDEIIYTTLETKTLEDYADDYASLRENATYLISVAANTEQNIIDVYLPILALVTDEEIKAMRPELLLRLIKYHPVRVTPLLRETGYEQFVLAFDLVGVAETEVVITVPIPPRDLEGILTIQLDDDSLIQVNYTSFVDSTFTIEATDFSVINATNPREVYIGY